MRSQTQENNVPSNLTRRRFVQGVAAMGAVSGLELHAVERDHAQQEPTHSENELSIADRGWSLWIDRNAHWEQDEIFLPGEFSINRLPVYPPSGGWQSLYGKREGDGFASVDLPVTLEQHFWGQLGKRSYTAEEYYYAADDPIPQNRACRGVFWLWRTIDIPASMAGKRILFHVRSARQTLTSAPAGAVHPQAPDGAHFYARMHMEDAGVWDLDAPTLYVLRATCEGPILFVPCGMCVFGARTVATIDLRMVLHVRR
jgi:hypothetical protein